MTLLIFGVYSSAKQAGGNPASQFVGSFLAASLITFLMVHAWEAKFWPATEPFARGNRQPSSKTLRVDVNAKLFVTRGGFLFERRYFFTATGLRPVAFRRERADQILRERQLRPVRIASNDARTWWTWGDVICWESCGYSEKDVAAVLTEQRLRHDRDLQRAHSVMAAGQLPVSGVRQPIPPSVKQAVYVRDGGRCVTCGVDQQLEFDHVIPHSRGGADSVGNLQLLCLACNRSKGTSIS
jgi:hypothetical protein